MKIVNYSPLRAVEIADLFHRCIHSIDTSAYSTGQQEAWAPTPPDYQRWTARLLVKKPYLAIIDNKVAGFIELESDGHIDCMYTSADFQRRGVATALFNHILVLARNSGNKQLYVEASIIAKPLFEKLGFSVLKENKVQLNQQTLINYKMQKLL